MKLNVFSLSVAVSLMSAPVLAEDDALKTQCEAASGIVTKLVDLRTDRKNERRAVRTLNADDTIEDAWKPAIPLLAGWVYTLSRDDLKLEPGKAYFDSCMAQ